MNEIWNVGVVQDTIGNLYSRQIEWNKKLAQAPENWRSCNGSKIRACCCESQRAENR